MNKIRGLGLNLLLFIILIFVFSQIAYADNHLGKEKGKESVLETTREFELQEATLLQLIGILTEEGSYSEAEQMLNMLNDYEKNSYDYYYLSGQIAESKSEYDKAIKFYKKASDKHPDNISLKIKILEIYAKDKKYKKQIKKEINEISNMQMSQAERKEFNDLKKILSQKHSKNYLLSLSTGLITTDNVYETKDDKKSDSGLETRLTFAHQIKSKNKITYTSFVSYGNLTYMDQDKKNSHDIYLGFEPAKIFSNWHTSMPLTFNYNIEDNEEKSTGYSIGFKGKKIVMKKSILGLGIDFSYTDNSLSNYDGLATVIYSTLDWGNVKNFKFNSKIKIENADYSEDYEKYLGYGGEIHGKKVFAEKYLISLGYGLTYKDYEENRKDLIHDLNLHLESNIGKTKWKYLLGYIMTVDDSDSNNYEYTKHKFSAKIKREFY